jgi:hypothetical protein
MRPDELTAMRSVESAVQTGATDRRFEIQRQRADAIYQAGGDVIARQYNEHALRIEPMRRRARNVMWAGFVMVFVGFAGALIGAAMWDASIMQGINGLTNVHPNVAGFAIAGVGSAVMGVGVLVIIVSLFMKRSVRREERRP